MTGGVPMPRFKASALVIFGLSILFLLFFQFCKQAPDLRPVNPFAEDPYDAVGSGGIQLALLAALLTLIHVFRPYPQSGMPSAQILLTLRGGTVALISVAVTLAPDAIGLARYLLTSGAFPATWKLAGLVGGMALLTLAAGWVFIRSARGVDVPKAPRPLGRAILISVVSILILALYPLAWRNAGVPGGIFTALAGMALLFVPVWGIATAIIPAMEFTYEDFFDDLSAIFQGLKKRLGRLAASFTWVEKVAAFPPLRRLMEWLNPRKHRWSLVVLVAVAMSLFLLLAEAVMEGMPGNLGRLLMVVSVYTGLEVAGVGLGYALLGRFLGIFRTE